MNIDIQESRQLCNGTVDVTTAEQDQTRTHTVYRDIHRHRAAAVRADSMLPVAGHPAVEHAGTPFVQRFHRLFNHFALHHTTADGTDSFSVPQHQHLCAVTGSAA